MAWADEYIKELQNGNTVSFRPRGNSMEGRINSGDLCTVSPISDYSILKKNDIVLCKVNGNQYLHLISNINKGHFQISNNKAYVNGWVEPRFIYGVLVKVEK